MDYLESGQRLKNNMKPIKRLYSWAVVYSQDPFLPPENNRIRLQGFYNKKSIITSSIKAFMGRLIYTSSGSRYYLAGQPSKEYSNWLAENNIILDISEPIKVLYRKK